MKAEYLKVCVLATAVGAAAIFVKNDYFFNVLTIAGLEALVVVGLSLLMGYAGQVSLGHAAFYGIGAYTSGILSAKYGVEPLLGMAAAQLLTLTIAFALGVPTLKLKGHYLAVATLGFGVIVEVFFKEAVELTGGPSGLVGIAPLGVGPYAIVSFKTYYLLTWAILILAVLISIHLVHSPVGRALLALHDSEAALRSLGYDVKKLKLGIFVFSSSLAALAGSLYAHFVTFISPYTFTFMHSVKFVTMVVIGGIASLWGALGGAVFLSVLPEVLFKFEDYEVVVFGLILIVVMIFSPEGLIHGLEKRLWRLVRS